MSVVDPDLGRKSEEVPFLFRLGSPCKRGLFSVSSILFLFISLPVLHGFQDHRTLTRDWTWGLGSEGIES